MPTRDERLDDIPRAVRRVVVGDDHLIRTGVSVLRQHGLQRSVQLVTPVPCADDDGNVHVSLHITLRVLRQIATRGLSAADV
jgi:hypothetical protein